MSASVKDITLEMKSSKDMDGGGYENAKFGIDNKAVKEDSNYEELTLGQSFSNDYETLRQTHTKEPVNLYRLTKIHEDYRENETKENQNRNVNIRKSDKLKTDVRNEQNIELPISTISWTKRGRKWKIVSMILLIISLGLTCALVVVSVLMSSGLDTPCTRGPCFNGGRCFTADEDYTCVCPKGFYGPQCDNTPCTRGPCLNGGQCFVEEDNYICVCPRGFNGSQCENTPCTIIGHCFNGGQCVVDDGDYKCVCARGYSGPKCETTPCDSSPCYNNGRCIINNNSFTCVCPCGYVGNLCKDKKCAANVSDDFSCILLQDNSDDYDWSYHSGPTPSSGTGPSSAYEGNYYYYFETSAPVVPGSEAKLIARIFDLDLENCLQFHYHMYGTQMGTLSIIHDQKQIWSQSGNQGDLWHLATVNFNPQDINVTQIIFEAVRGSGYKSDIAIDNIIIKPEIC